MLKSSNPALSAFHDLMTAINHGNEKGVKKVLGTQYVQRIINGDPRALNNGIPLLHALHPKTGTMNVVIISALLSIETIKVNFDLNLSGKTLVEFLTAANLSATDIAKINVLLLARGSKTLLATPTPSVPLTPTVSAAPTLSAPPAVTTASSPKAPLSTHTLLTPTPSVSLATSATLTENLDDEDFVLVPSAPPTVLAGSPLTSQQSANQQPITWSQWLSFTAPKANSASKPS